CMIVNATGAEGRVQLSGHLGIVLASRYGCRRQPSVQILEPWQERIPDGNCKPRGVRVIELLVVVNDVVMHLGTYKRVSPEVIAHVGAEVAGEVVAAYVVGTSGEGSAVQDAVESEVFTTDSGHDVSPELLVSPGINAIEVVE